VFLASNVLSTTISENAIFDNDGAGIVVSSNANGDQQPPVIDDAVSDGGQTSVSGTVSGTPSADYAVEVFANLQCDPSGSGEGEAYLGTATITLDAVGGGAFTYLHDAGLAEGEIVTATATDLSTGNTSAFSVCATVRSGDTGNDTPLAPEATPAGGRYLWVTPAAGPDAVALAVTGTAGDPETACLGAYVQSDGHLGANPVYRLPEAWGTLAVYGEAVRPDTEYLVEAQVTGSGNRSTPVSAVTWRFGDVDANEVVNFSDILEIVLGFQGDFEGRTLESLDIAPCLPHGVINFDDIQQAVLAFRGEPFGCAPPCQ